MAEDPKNTPDAQARGAAEARAEGEKRQIDETVPGGRYLVNDVLVDSEGVPVKGK